VLFERVAHPTLDPVWYRWKRSEAGTYDGFMHAIFTRLGGVSRGAFASLNLGGTVGDDVAAVEENHRRVFAALGYAGEAWVSPHQVHGNRVAVVGAADRGQVIAATDALVTNEPGVALLLRFADCVPVLFFDSRQRVVAIAHAGWRGVVAGVVAATVETLVSRFGTQPRDLWVGIGPAIGRDHYAVGKPVRDAVTGALPQPSSLQVSVQHEQGHYLDLAAAVEAQLTGMGIVDVNQAGICTACNTDEWFSHRAEAGMTGRFCAVAMLT
jgi:polyphenol oxidase